MIYTATFNTESKELTFTQTDAVTEVAYKLHLLQELKAGSGYSMIKSSMTNTIILPLSSDAVYRFKLQCEGSQATTSDAYFFLYTDGSKGKLAKCYLQYITTSNKKVLEYFKSLSALLQEATRNFASFNYVEASKNLELISSLTSENSIR